LGCSRLNGCAVQWLCRSRFNASRSMFRPLSLSKCNWLRRSRFKVPYTERSRSAPLKVQCRYGFINSILLISLFIMERCAECHTELVDVPAEAARSPQRFMENGIRHKRNTDRHKRNGIRQYGNGIRPKQNGIRHSEKSAQPAASYLSLG